MNSGGCIGCQPEVQEKLRQREAIIKLANEKAKTDKTQYVIWREAGQWRTERIDTAIARGVPLIEVIGEHL